AKENLNQGVSKRDIKASSNFQKSQTKNLSRESFVDSRITARNSLVQTRKSLPVLKRVKQAEEATQRGFAESSGEAKELSRIPVKAKFGKKVVPQVSNARNHLWRNRASDGFVIMAPRTNMDAHALSRKSIKPIVKATLRVSNSQRTSKSKCLSALSKSKSVVSISSKEEEILTSFLQENIALKASDEAIKGQPSSDGSMNPSKSTSDVISRKKSNRRRSYTSLLMERSKILEDHGEVMYQEKLPNIDDGCNQLEVAEYVDEIYRYYWVAEAQYPSLADYMLIQKFITPRMRGILINWLIEVHFKFDLMQETLYLMVTLLDQYLSQVNIEKNEMQLVGLTSLLLESEYEDFWHPRIKDLISISAELYTRNQVLGMEKLILGKLKFRLNAPTPVFMLRFLKAASDRKLEHLAFYLIELCLAEYEALKFKSSMLCASALYIARCTLQITPAWTPLLHRHARYDVPQFRDCAVMILRFQKIARQLKVTYEKYMGAD
ncbi:LOW QUALITY PROTEIN: Cyclin_N domain-containing protein/Cyclin_C domain-containing protein, partial [Cephalotus follicularis]